MIVRCAVIPTLGRAFHGCQMDASRNTSERVSDRGSNVTVADGPTASAIAAAATVVVPTAKRLTSVPSEIRRIEVRRRDVRTRNKGRLADAMGRNTRHGLIRSRVAEYR
jgi:hypothetical protein